MQLEKLYLQNFRCYEDVEFTFAPGVNVFCGANAQGKSTILEALYLLMSGRSFRSSTLRPLVRTGSKGFSVEAYYSKYQVAQVLKFSFLCQGESQGGERTIIHNKTHYYPSSTNLLGLLQGVLMDLDDIAIVKGVPASRRELLDNQLLQVDPLYVHHLIRYQKALRQRNALLRSKSVAAMDSWEQILAQSGAYLILQRRRLLIDLETRGQELYNMMSGQTRKLQLRYISKSILSDSLKEMQEFFLKQFLEQRQRDLYLGYTSVGPHRDDMTILIGEQDSRSNASEGEQRSCVASLRLAEWQRLGAEAHAPPLMLIDDFGVSLDENRKERLLNYLCGLGQVFLTTTQEIKNSSFHHLFLM